MNPPLQPPCLPPQSHHVPGWLWKKGLEVAHRASLFPDFSKATWADGSLPPVLRTQNPIRRHVCPSPWPASREEGEAEAAHVGQAVSLWLWGLLPLSREDVLPYFQDKVSFLRAMCWTNQVNWEAPDRPDWATLFFLLQADSADRQITHLLVSPKPMESAGAQGT